MSAADLAQLIAQGGTAGLILALIVALAAFSLGKVRRGAEVTEWQDVAKSALAGAEASVAASNKASANVDKLIPLVERLVAGYERQAIEANVRREDARRVP